MQAFKEKVKITKKHENKEQKKRTEQGNKTYFPYT